jgi:MoaA/NifB/PqqE/SkfB family radical SAM enzyme
MRLFFPENSHSKSNAMVPKLEIAAAFLKTYRKLISDSENVPLFLRNPKHLYSLVKKGEKRRLKNSKKFNIPIPRICIFSVTWDCNLSCSGCYAKNYKKPGNLKIQDIYSIAKGVCDLGSYVFIIAGGEPFMVPDLVTTLSNIPSGLFIIFTNGTLFSDEHIRQLQATRNIVPIISIEGETEFTDRRRGKGVTDEVQRAMNKLRSANIAFGFSATASHENLIQITSREWLDKLWKEGARFGFIIDYIPFKTDFNPALVLTKEDMEYKKAVLKQRKIDMKPLLMNFPPEEYDADGCKSAGKGLIHINADGFVEPCPFCHYASDNILKKPLEAILASEFLSTIRNDFKNVDFNGTCLLFEHEDRIKEIAARTEARRTDALPLDPVKRSSLSENVLQNTNACK